MAIERSVSLYRRIQGPLSLMSLMVCLLGVGFGWIYSIFGLTLYFNQGGYDTGTAAETGLITTGEAGVVIGAGVGLLVLGYLGWKGFMRFAY